MSGVGIGENANVLFGVGGNANFTTKYTNMLVYFALGDSKVWRWGSKPKPGPNANGFALQWNIGFTVFLVSFTGLTVKSSTVALNRRAACL